VKFVSGKDIVDQEGPMSHAMSGAHAQRLIPAPGRLDLRGRVGWICHGLRIAAAVWAGWILVIVLIAWSDKAAVLEAYQRLLSVDLSGVSAARYACALAFVLIGWGFAATVAFCLWRLFGTYLAGRVFTVDAVAWLRRAGLAGVAAVAVDVMARLAIVGIFAGKLMLVSPRGLLILPQDLLHLIFAMFVLALAYIFKAAAEMAEDHAQIV
jgi:hypothetical protein